MAPPPVNPPDDPALALAEGTAGRREEDRLMRQMVYTMYQDMYGPHDARGTGMKEDVRTIKARANQIAVGLLISLPSATIALRFAA